MRHRFALRALGLVVAIAVSVAAIIALRDTGNSRVANSAYQSDDVQAGATGNPGAVTSTTLTSVVQSSTTVSAVIEEPRALYSVRDKTKIVRVDPVDGSWTLVFDASSNVDEVGRLSVAPSGLIFFEQDPGSFCRGTKGFWAYDPVTGSTAGPFPGGGVSVSPDGSSLAVTVSIPDDMPDSDTGEFFNGCRGIRIIPISDGINSDLIEGGGTQVLGLVLIDWQTEVSDLAWSADGSEVVLTASFEDTVQIGIASDGSESFDSVEYMSFANRGECPAYDDLTFQPDGTIVAEARCKDDQGRYHSEIHRYDMANSEIIESWGLSAGGRMALAAEFGAPRIAYVSGTEGTLTILDSGGQERSLGFGYGAVLAW